MQALENILPVEIEQQVLCEWAWSHCKQWEQDQDLI